MLTDRLAMRNAQTGPTVNGPMLGSPGEKIARVVDLAEDLYERMTELREQVNELRDTTQETHARVSALEEELADQRGLLEAIAEAQGVDIEAVESGDIDPEDGEREESAAESAERR